MLFFIVSVGMCVHFSTPVLKLQFEGSCAKMDKLKVLRKRGAFLRSRVTQLMH